MMREGRKEERKEGEHGCGVVNRERIHLSGKRYILFQEVLF
jgi:hypothetical protein